MNTNVKKINLDIDMSKSKRKGANIEAAVAAVGKTGFSKICVNGKCTSFKAEGLMKRHGKEKFQIKLD